jgi:hypothetical protein
MTVYEMRTYTLHVGKMGEAVKLYIELGYPALQKGGQDKKLIGYFQADSGTINQLVHLWKFDDDADRRAHWASVFANKDFVELRGEVPSARRVSGGQAADGSAVGTTSLRERATISQMVILNVGLWVVAFAVA